MQGRSIDAPLNETGKIQAKAVASYLENETLDKIVSSSMQRARQTAEPLLRLQKNNTEFISHKDLDEMDFGKFEGKKYRDCKYEIEQVHKRWVGGDTSYRIPGGESPEEVWHRAGKRAGYYLDHFAGKSIAFVIHGRVIRILLSVWTGLGLRNMHRIEHANGAINRLKYSGKSFEVIYLNRISHLSGQGSS